MEEYILQCACGSENVVRNGLDNDGQTQRWLCKVCGSRANPIRKEDVEICKAAVKLANQKQKFEDTNRIERKSYRNNARIDNALLELYKEFIRVLEQNKITYKPKKMKKVKVGSTMIIQISDTHFNELVDLPSNNYDLAVAKTRLNRLYGEAMTLATVYAPEKIIIALTGDNVNSDRRIDEILNMAEPRAKAMFFALDVLKEFILNVNMYHDTEVAYITGNESRLDKELGYSKNSAYQNYDYIIYESLVRILESTNIKFHKPENPWEYILKIYDKNILLIHDASDMKRIRSKYGAMGTAIHFILHGHKHEAYLSDYHARSGSLVGANGFSEHRMEVASRASQNIIIVHKDKFIDCIKVDLQ